MVGACLVAVFALGAIVAGPALAESTKKFEEKGVNALTAGCPTEDTEVNDCFVRASPTVAQTAASSRSEALGSAEQADHDPGRTVTAKGRSLRRPAGQWQGNAGSPAAEGSEGDQADHADDRAARRMARRTEASLQGSGQKQRNRTDGQNRSCGRRTVQNPARGGRGQPRFEEGTAFILPLKVSLHNAFLEKLGGGPCEFGNDEHPIYQHLTTEPEKSGTGGNANSSAKAHCSASTARRLTDISWEVPAGGRAERLRRRIRSLRGQGDRLRAPRERLRTARILGARRHDPHAAACGRQSPCRSRKRRLASRTVNSS